MFSRLDASTVIFAGALIFGALVSVTVIFWIAVAVFFATSVAVQVTIVSPRGNEAGASFVTDKTPTKSVTAGVLRSTSVCVPFASTTISARLENTGGVESPTVTVCVAIPTFPALSIAVHITVVIPSGNSAGALFVSDLIPLSSFAIAIPIETLVKPPVAST